MVGGRFVHAGTTPGRRGHLLQTGPNLRESDIGKAEKDETQDRGGILRGVEAAIRPQLVGRIPETLFQRVCRSVFLRWGDPLHVTTSSYGFWKGENNLFPSFNHPRFYWPKRLVVA